MSIGISSPNPGSYYRDKINEKYLPLGGFDIYKTKNKWIAIVACEKNGQKSIRFYRWIWKEWKHNWGLDLARMSCDYWDWEAIFEQIKILKKLYNIEKN